MKLRFTFWIALLFQTGAYSQNTVLWVDCGGEGERPCIQSEANKGWGLLPANTPSDNWSNDNDRLRCDSGLQIHNTPENTLRCVNRNRMSVGESDASFNPPWLSFARQNQFGSIQADQPITFAPILGTHNSYSNYFDGAESAFSTDQGFNITDQLQYGARFLRLDPWYFTKTDFQIKLCHSGADIIPGDDSTGGTSLCDKSDELGKKFSLDRSFIFAIKEIAHWLRLHPSEFIVLDLHDSAQGWGSATDQITGLIASGPGQAAQIFISTQAYFAPVVEHELGNMVYMNPLFAGKSTGDLSAAPGDYRFPSLRQLRTMGKQVIILSEFPNQWAFEAKDGSGLLAIQASPDQYDTLPCTSGFSFAGLHTPGTFAQTGEDRTLSVPDKSKMVDSPRLEKALKCGYNLINVDFLGTLSQAPNPALPGLDFQCDDFSDFLCHTVDHRRELSIWSWGPNQGAPNQPVQMINTIGDSFGSWISAPENSLASYLCAGPGSGSSFPDATNPDGKNWYVTNAGGLWRDGEAVCQSEKGTGWHFWHPMSALQNSLAWNAMVNGGKFAAWINHFQGPIQALPQGLSFAFRQGQIPASKTIVISGGFGGKLSVASSDPRFSVSVVPLYTTRNLNQASDNNDSNLFTVSVTSVGASLAGGTHNFSISIREDSSSSVVNPGVVQVTPRTDIVTIPVTLNITAPSNVTVTTNPPGLTIAADGVTYTSPHVFSWWPGDLHLVDAPGMSATPGVLTSFVNWSDGQGRSHQVTAPSSDQTLTASFSLSYLLTLNSTGNGTVSANPPGTGSYYASGAIVQITAAPQSGSYLIGFSGALSGAANPQNLTMNAPRSVTAAFGDLGSPRINVTASVIDDHDPSQVRIGLVLNNTGGAAAPVTISVTPAVLTGSGTVSLTSPLTPVPSIAGGQSVTVPLTFDWPSSAARIRLTVGFTANAGAYQGSQILSLFR